MQHDNHINETMLQMKFAWHLAMHKKDYVTALDCSILWFSCAQSYWTRDRFYPRYTGLTS